MKKTFKILLILFFAGCLCTVIGGFALYQWAAKDLPGFKKITDYKPPLVTTVLTKNGDVLGYFYKEKRFLVRLEEMSPWLPKAFLAAEDSSFYEHEGVDLKGIFRAFVVNVMAGEVRQGGSTITQQVIKRLLLSSEKKYRRKIKEAILAYRLERYLTKEEILTIYLNHNFLGAHSYGVEAAAREYFGKHAKELTLAESALLAGLLQAPSRYNPYRRPEAARNRQVYVLDQLKTLGWITPDEYETAINQELVYQKMEDPSWKDGAYYLEEVRRWLIAEYGEEEVYTGGLTVQSMCDMTHQKAAEIALHNGLLASAHRRGWTGPLNHLEPDGYEAFLAEEKRPVQELLPGEWVKVLVTEVGSKGAKVSFGGHEGYISVKTMGWCRKPNPDVPHDYVKDVSDARKVVTVGDVVWAIIVSPPDKEKDKKLWNLKIEREPEIQGAIVSLDPTNGDVLALCGGYDFNQSQFNRATQAKRQPGSAFKPIVYSAAMDNGYTPASIIMDAPIVFANDDEGKLWRPENYEGIFYGPTLLRTALVKSRNLVTIRLAQKIGIRTIINRAKDLGLDTEFPEDLSVSLGSASVSLMNLCQAYSTFARDGSYIVPRLVDSVKSAWGEQVYQSSVESVEAISPQTAFIMSSLMKQVVQNGTGFRAKALGRPVAGKTGTTNDARDAWFMGFTPYLLTGVYVGFDRLKPMGRLETGSRAASPIWVEYRKAVEDMYPYTDFTQPDGIVVTRVDGKNGKLAGPFSAESYFLPFKEGSEPALMAKSPGMEEGNGITSSDDLFKQVF